MGRAVSRQAIFICSIEHDKSPNKYSEIGAVENDCCKTQMISALTTLSTALVDKFQEIDQTMAIHEPSRPSEALTGMEGYSLPASTR